MLMLWIGVLEICAKAKETGVKKGHRREGCQIRKFDFLYRLLFGLLWILFSNSLQATQAAGFSTPDLKLPMTWQNGIQDRDDIHPMHTLKAVTSAYPEDDCRYCLIPI